MRNIVFICARFAKVLAEEVCCDSAATVRTRKENMEKTRRRMAESVEEQGLLLLVWRHHITKQYMKDVL